MCPNTARQRLTSHFAVNHARAMRVAEIMSDFRSLQYYLAAVQATPPAEDYYMEGYSILRACIAEAQTVLAAGYSHTSLHPHGDAETEKSQLKLYVYPSTEEFCVISASGCTFPSRRAVTVGNCYTFYSKNQSVKKSPSRESS